MAPGESVVLVGGWLGAWLGAWCERAAAAEDDGVDGRDAASPPRPPLSKVEEEEANGGGEEEEEEEAPRLCSCCLRCSGLPIPTVDANPGLPSPVRRVVVPSIRMESRCASASFVHPASGVTPWRLQVWNVEVRAVALYPPDEMWGLERSMRRMSRRLAMAWDEDDEEEEEEEEVRGLPS
jgi:hypothetical protein